MTDRSSGDGSPAPDYLPARMVNEFVYCPRLFYYEWVEGLFAHSADTVDGAFKHRRVDARSDALPAPDGQDADGPADEPIVARSVELSSDEHGVIAKIDLVEGDGRTMTPIDYKKGRPFDGENGPEPWPSDRIQIGVQALVLRDSGYACREGLLYYHTTKQRVRVPIDDQLVTETRVAVASARATATGGVIPPPLIDSPKCPRCSLVGICLPDETAFSSRLPGGASALDDDEWLQPWLIGPTDVAAPGGNGLGAGADARASNGDAEEPAAGAGLRRLVPARDDLRPLYVIGQGLTLGKSGEVLRVKDRDRKVVQEARLNDVSQVNLFGNITITAPALQGLCAGEKPVAHFSGGGWFYGLTHAIGPRNAYLRAEQFRRADQPAFCRAVAGRLVAAKIRNQRTLLQRNHVEPPRVALAQLKALALSAERAQDLGGLLGVEGTAARTYFQHFGGMIKVAGENGMPAFTVEGRNRRPPRDPVNALLSLAYSLLSKDLTIVCTAIGLDPFWGFYHQPRFGRPALALDLMEMFRPLVADSAVLTAINNRMVDVGSFVRVGPAVTLTPAGRKGLLRAYEQRMDGLVTHPLFGYRVSYRRVLEIQARLLARFVAGEIEELPPFETR